MHFEQNNVVYTGGKFFEEPNMWDRVSLPCMRLLEGKVWISTVQIILNTDENRRIHIEGISLDARDTCWFFLQSDTGIRAVICGRFAIIPYNDSWSGVNIDFWEFPGNGTVIKQKVSEVVAPGLVIASKKSFHAFGQDCYLLPITPYEIAQVLRE